MSSCIITDSQRLKGWRSERERERDRKDDGERMLESKRQKERDRKMKMD